MRQDPSQNHYRRSAFSLLIALPIWACGTNVLAPAESADPAHDAILALEAGESDKAIDILEAALQDEPDVAKFKSLLAMAYAQRAGLDPIDYALNLAGSEEDEESEAESDSNESTNQITASFDLMPEATERNISDLNLAVTLLAEIPAAERLVADYFKLALFQTAALTLTAKALDVDRDGTISINEALLLSDDAATGLVTSLAAATSVLLASPSQEGNMGAVTTKLLQVQTDIGNSEGSDPADQVRNFLAD